MQVLLRTASTYARACLETAAQIEVKPTQRISVHQNAPVEMRLADIANATTEALAEVLELHATRATIRNLIGHGNNETIDGLLSERDALNTQEKILNDLINELADKPEKSVRTRRWAGLDPAGSSRLEHDTAQVTAALDTIRQRMATVTSGDVADYVEVPSLPQDKVKTLKNQVASIRRRRTVLNDRLAVENLRLHITLPPEVVAVLRKHQIIE